MKRLLTIMGMPVLLLMFVVSMNQLEAQETTVTIGSGTTYQHELPFNNNSKNGFTQMMYYHSELGGAGYIGSISYEYDNEQMLTLSELTIWMAMLSDSSLASSNSWVAVGDAHQVYHAMNFSLPMGVGTIEIPLDSAFNYDGNSHLAIMISHKSSDRSSGVTFAYTPTEVNSCLYRGSNYSTSYAEYPTTSFGTLSQQRPNITLLKNVTNDFCFPPKVVTFTSIDETSITFSCESMPGVELQTALLDTAMGSDLSGATVVTMTGDSHTFDNLSSNTTYWMGVRKVCGEGEYSDWKRVLVSTIQTPSALPYTCDFESEDDRGLWSFESGDRVNHWTISGSAHHGEGSQNGLHVTNSANDIWEYDMDEVSFVYAKTLLHFPEAGEYNVAFDWHGYGQYRYDYMRVMFVPVTQIGELEAGASMPMGLTVSSVPEGMVAADGGSLLYKASEWMRAMNVAEIPEAGNYYMVCTWTNNSGRGSNPPAAIDNIFIERNMCPGVDSVDVENITSTTVDITGYSASGSSFMLYYKPKDSETYDTVEMESPFTLTGLEPSTYYNAIIRSNCGEGVSYTSLEFDFGTDCVPIMLPWSYGAEERFMKHNHGSERYPYCWENINGDGDSYCWKMNIGGAAHTGHTGIEFYGSYSGSKKHNDWLFTPEIPFTGNEELSFWVKGGSPDTASDRRGRFKIYVSNDMASGMLDTANYDVLQLTDSGIVNNTIEVVGNDWKQWKLSLPNSLVGTYHLAFVVDGMSSFTFDMDDIYLTTVSSCPVPEQVRVTEVMDNSATLTWTGTGTSYTVYYGAPGFAMDTALTLTVSTNEAMLTSLLPNMEYEVKVTAVCENGDVSATSMPIEFVTTCVPIEESALPFVEDFSDNVAGGTQPLDDCWIRGTNNNFDMPYVMSRFSNGTPNSLYFLGSSSCYSYVALPTFENYLNELVLTCSMLTTEEDSRMMVGVMSNPYDTSTFVVYDTVEVVGVEEWMDVQLVLSEYNMDDGQYLTMMCVEGPRSVVYVDNIRIEKAGVCASATNLSVEDVMDTCATVRWDAGELSQWMVYVGAPGFDPDTVSAPISVDTNQIVLTGLESQTKYEFMVKGVCADGSYSVGSVKCGFKTICSPISTLPYVENFEQYGVGEYATIDPCWYKGMLGNSYVGYPQVNASEAITGNRSLLLQAGTSYRDSYRSYVAMSKFAQPLNTLRLRFNMKSYGSDSYMTISSSRLAVGVMSNPEDATTFDTVAIYDMSREPSGTVMMRELLLDSYDGENGHLAFMATTPATEYGRDGENVVYIDDIEVARIPTCNEPTGMRIDSVSTTSISVAWEGNGVSYEVVYALSEDMANSQMVTSATNSVSLMGLNEYTDYYIKVRGLCADGTYSEWSEEALVARTAMNCGENSVSIYDTIGVAENVSSRYVINTSTTYDTTCNWTIYTASELNELGLVDTNNNIYSIGLQTGEAGSDIPLRIYMMETTKSFFITDGDSVPLSQMTLVYNDTMHVESNSWNEITLDSTYNYNGMDNLMIAFVRDDSLAASTAFYHEGIGINRTLFRYVKNGVLSNYPSANRANMIFNICSEIASCARPLNVVMTEVESNSIEMHWDGAASDYEIAYGAGDFDPNNITTEQTMVSVSGNSATLTGLSENTDYYIYVRSVCGAERSIWSYEVMAHTPCMAIALPYSENFDRLVANSYPMEAEGFVACWSRGSNGMYAYPFVSNGSIPASYPNCVEFFGSDNEYSYAALPMFATPVNNTMMQLKLRRSSSSTAVMQVGVMSDPNDYTTFEAVEALQVETIREWELFEVSFGAYAGSGKYIAMMLPAGESCYIQMDDLEVFEIPACQSPNEVTIPDSTITGTTAVVHWNDREERPANGYELEYGPRGFVLGSGTRVTSQTNPATLSGLLVGAQYDVYVRAMCATEDGRWSFVASFETDCGAIALPVSYDFEYAETGGSAALPHCFARYNDAQYSKTAPYVTSSSNSSNYLYWSMNSYGSAANNAAIVFPEIDTMNYPMNGNQITFRGKGDDAGTYMYVGIMQDPSDFATFTLVDSVMMSNVYEVYTVSFENYVGNGKYVALNMKKGNTTLRGYVDDIVIEEIPTCPRVYDMRAIAATATTATVAWEDSIGTTQWIVEYREVGTNAVQTVGTTNNPCVLSGLNPVTRYYFNVRPICASGDTSALALHDAVFNTTQVPAVLPYAYDFEEETEWNQWQINSNKNVAWYRGTTTREQGSYAMYVSNDEGENCKSEWKRTVNAVVYRDVDFGTDTSSFTMKFKANVGGTAGNDRDGLVVLLADPVQDVVASDDEHVSPWGSAEDVALTVIERDTVWTTYYTHFEQIAGVHRVAFYWYNENLRSNMDYVDYAAAIDDIEIAEQHCLRPYGLEALNVEMTTTTLSWRGNAGSYEVKYYQASEPEENGVTTIVNGNILNVQNLMETTAYRFKVRAICGVGDTSYWSDEESFRTICNRYVASDTIREHFTHVTGAVYNSEMGDLPACWESYSDGENGVKPHVVESGSYWYSHEGKSLVMTSGSSYGSESIVRLPHTMEPVNTLTLSFWMCTESDRKGVLEVGYLVGQDLSADFVAVKSISASVATKHDGLGDQETGVGLYDTVSFETAPERAQTVALRWMNDGSYYTVNIDDVVLYSDMTCMAPVVTSTMVDYQSATIGWTGEGVNYQLMIRTFESTEWSDTIETTGMSYVFDSLTPLTDYVVRLRTQCGADGNSVWVEQHFTTEALPCFEPTNVETIAIGYEDVRLRWNTEGTASEWVVNVFNSNDNIMDTVTEQTAEIAGLYAGMEYAASVKSLCGGDKMSDWSDTIVFTTKDCEKVNNVAVDDITSNSAVITWEGADAVKWEVNYGVDIDQGAGEFVETTERTYVIMNLEPEETYDVYVRAYCTETLYGQWSDKIMFTTAEVQGIDELGDVAMLMVVYPNPTGGSFKIRLKGVAGKVTLQVVDINGRWVYEEEVECGEDCEKCMDVEGLTKGTYFVKVVGAYVNGVRKLIVR